MQEPIENYEEEEAGSRISPLELAAFVTESARRHKKLGLTIFGSISVLGFVVASVLPKTYETRTRILVSQEGLMAHVNPDRINQKVDEFKGLSERMFRQENLRGIVRDAHLSELWTKHRPPVLAAKDSILRNGLDRLGEEDRTRALMGTLETKLWMETDNSTSITIAARWTDPFTVTELVKVAKQRFLDDRLNRDLEVYREVVTILEGEAKTAARDVERLLKEVDRATYFNPSEASGAKVAAIPAKEASSEPSLRKEEPAPEKPDPLLVVKLEKVRQGISEAQAPFQRRLTELKLQLADLKASYGPKHPLVINQEKRIEDASVTPPELLTLREEERSLLAQIESFVPSGDTPRPGRSRVVSGSGASASEPRGAQGPVRIEQSATLSAAQSKLIQAINKYNDLSARIATTRLEIASSETAFKFRYVTALEPEMPSAPTKPKLPLMIRLGGIVLGALLALLAGAARELLRGRLIAPFQVKQLGLPLLAEIHLRDRPKTRRG